MDHAGVDGAAGPRDHREEHVVVKHLNQHEALILVEVGRRVLVGAHVALSQLAGRARDEVVDTFLRLDSLVDVIVPGEHDVDVVSHEDRLQDDTQIDRRTMPGGVRVERMMEVTDLPWLPGVPERRLQPLHLLRIELRAVEHDETHVVAGVGVVALPVHVVQLVRHVVGPVMVAKARPKRHAGLQQRRVRLLELVDEVRWLLSAVHVVAQHDDEVVGKRRMGRRHLPRDVILRLIARPVVANCRELQRAGLVRERRGLFRRTACRDRGHEEGQRDDWTSVATASGGHGAVIKRRG